MKSTGLGFGPQAFSRQSPLPCGGSASACGGSDLHVGDTPSSGAPAHRTKRNKTVAGAPPVFLQGRPVTGVVVVVSCVVVGVVVVAVVGGVVSVVVYVGVVAAVRWQRGQHGLVLSLLPLPCCLGVSGWNSELPLPCCFNALGWNSGVFLRGRPARCPSGVAPGQLFLCCLWAIVQVGIMCFFSFLADPAGLASFGCPHRSLAVLTLLSLPFCLRVRGWNYDFLFLAAALALLLECISVAFWAFFLKGGPPEL